MQEKVAETKKLKAETKANISKRAIHIYVNFDVLELRCMSGQSSQGVQELERMGGERGVPRTRNLMCTKLQVGWCYAKLLISLNNIYFLIR